MKLAITKHWYRVSISASLLLLSLSILVFALKYNAAYAGTPKQIPSTMWIVGVGNNIYKVNWNVGESHWDVVSIWQKP